MHLSSDAQRRLYSVSPPVGAVCLRTPLHAQPSNLNHLYAPLLCAEQSRSSIMEFHRCQIITKVYLEKPAMLNTLDEERYFSVCVCGCVCVCLSWLYSSPVSSGGPDGTLN